MILEKCVGEPCPHCSINRWACYDFVLRRFTDLNIPVVCKRQPECKAEMAALVDAPTAPSRPVERLV